MLLITAEGLCGTAKHYNIKDEYFLMVLALIFIIACALLTVGYFVYGGFLTRWVGVQEDRQTPAHEYSDGVDYVPAHTPVLFGHHFSSIAGAGPIVGPILAGIWFGWLPALVWIVIGSIFVGGVHDYTAMMASLRHKGRSIAELCRNYLSPVTYRVFLAFIWFTLVYVLIVFLDLTAGTFAPAVEAEAETGGAVATASLFYVGIALLFGLTVRQLKLSYKWATLIFVPLVFGALIISTFIPLRGELLPVFYVGPKYTWCIVLLAYCYIASITPVYILLQPRDYLSSFLLYACLLGGGIGLVLAGVTGHVALEFPAWTGAWKDMGGHTGFIFPLLFITVACGAVSGFHSIVASGTSSKQLNKERNALPVAYAGMLVEGALGLIALAGVMIVAQGADILNQPPTKVFGAGIGAFLETLHIPAKYGQQFGLLAISTFLLTTLDTGTRLSRFIFEEFFGLRHKNWRFISSAATLILPAIIVFMRFPDPQQAGHFIPAWQYIWPVFGTTNQLLAAMALLVVFIWFAKTGKRKVYVLLPMLFMLATTFTMLIQLIQQNLLGPNKQFLIGSICALLLILALLVVGDTIRCWGRISTPEREQT
ncbi:MAG: carbon starvation protein A [Lentisphaeria bacterium]